ncbi:hypothetical protein SSUR61_0451 [Streptococcus suis R61]|uniref:Uncharacterized protein n=1 Tax=Streptococcus suis R61 TaxID=996306 RepID=A0AA87FA95_STRSU|nr:hypothetical protein SSUR61_0451 [Streptococcus suis R61]
MWSNRWKMFGLRLLVEAGCEDFICRNHIVSDEKGKV